MVFRIEQGIRVVNSGMRVSVWDPADLQGRTAMEHLVHLRRIHDVPEPVAGGPNMACHVSKLPISLNISSELCDSARGLGSPTTHICSLRCPCCSPVGGQNQRVERRREGDGGDVRFSSGHGLEPEVSEPP